MSIWLLLIAGAVVALGAAVQGAVGYGMALVAAPILALIDPTLVPVPMIMLASVHSVLAVVRDGRHADWRGVGWAMLGRLPGTALGVLAVLMLSQRAFSLLIGVCVLAFVGLSLLTWRPQPRPGSLVLAGVASGVGGTAASIGGPPIALLYQNATGPRVRGTMGAYFVLGSLTSVAALGSAGQVPSGVLLSTAALLPFLIVGFVLSGPARRGARRRLDADRRARRGRRECGAPHHAVADLSSASAVQRFSPPRCAPDDVPGPREK